MKPRRSVVSVVAAHFLGPFAAKISDHLRIMCGGNLELRAASGDTSKQSVLLQSMMKHPLRALICISIRPSLDMIAGFRALNVPVILLDEEMSGAASIACDNFRGGQLAGEYLVRQGHRQIAIVSGATTGPGSLNAERRVAGFEAALAAKKLEPWRRVEVTDYLQADGLTALPKCDGSTAIFCAAGDMCATGIMRAAKDAGATIPRDLSVVGFDDADIAQIVRPALTTVHQPLKAMAEAAYRMACVEPSRTLARPQQLRLQPELVVRDSVAQFNDFRPEQLLTVGPGGRTSSREDHPIRSSGSFLVPERATRQ